MRYLSGFGCAPCHRGGGQLRRSLLEAGWDGSKLLLASLWVAHGFIRCAACVPVRGGANRHSDIAIE